MYRDFLAESDEELVDEVMDYFDFERVEKTMEALDWKWSGIEGTPQAPDLRKRVRGLIREVLWELNRKQQFFVGTGGFTVRGQYLEGKKYIDVSFQVANWSNYE